MTEHEIPPEFLIMRYWERGLDVARTWYHEEWEGAWIQLCLARDIAQAIEDAISDEFFSTKSWDD